MALFDSARDTESLVWKHRGLLGVSALILFLVVLYNLWPYTPEIHPSAATANTDSVPIRIVTITSRLLQPWGLAFLPDGDILVTEKRGTLRVIHEGQLKARSVAGVPTVVTKEQAGLMDIALHPRFAENHLLYLTYSKPGPGGDTPTLLRARFDGDRLSDVRDIFVSDAWSPSGGNNGSRIAFGPDGMIYMTIGDRHEQRPAQDLTNHKGKIVRLRDDGTVPDDNPFVGQRGRRPKIFAYGVRTPQGLVFHPQTGQLFENEHGPRGGDELNLILSGHNYGWPAITYGRNYDGSIVSTETEKSGMDQPLAYWVPSIAPSGMTVYTGKAFPSWQGNIFLGALAGGHLRRIVLDGTRVVRQEELLTNLHSRIRDVRQGPDGFLYVLTEINPGSLLRIEPAQ
jgi:glucose/arabinose dehydrogenase